MPGLTPFQVSERQMYVTLSLRTLENTVRFVLVPQGPRGCL